MIWFTCLRSCRLGCSHHSAGHGCVAACWAFCAMLELGLLTLQTVSHCHSTHWGGMEKEISCDIINKVILGEICKSIMPKSPERDGIQSKFTNKQINLCENLAHKLEEPEQERLRETKTKGEKVGPRQGQCSGQLWQHRSLFPAPPLLPRSQCKGVLLNHTHCVQLP